MIYEDISKLQCLYTKAGFCLAIATELRCSVFRVSPNK